MTTLQRLRDTFPGRLVWNRAARRPRMPLRILLGFGLWLAFGIAVSDLLASVVTGRTPVFQLRTSHLGYITVSAIDLVVGATATPIALYLAARYVDRRPFREFGLGIDREWWVDLGAGFVLGGALMTSIFLLQLALGWVTIHGAFVIKGGFPAWTFLPWLLLAVFSYVVGSVLEELLYRGFALTNLAEGFQVGPVGRTGAVGAAVLLTSGFFAFAHAGAPNATAISTAAIALAGVFLGLGYVLTGELAFPIGVHVAWNFFEGNLYGFPISGSGTTSVLSIEQGGPDAVTGGAFGPEAGLLGVIAILAGIVATVAWARYRHGTPAAIGRLRESNSVADVADR